MSGAINTPYIDVRSVRRARGLTQEAFAQTFGFTVGAIRDWEQGRKQPDRAARTLLAVILLAPDAVAEAVAQTAASNA